MAIRTTPKSTGDKKGKGKNKKPNPKVQEIAPKNRDDLKLWDAYQQALAKGRGNQFLRQHPKFKANSGIKAGKNPAAGYKNDLEMGTNKMVAAEPAVVQQQGIQAGTLQNVGQAVGPTGTASQYWDGTKWVQKREDSANQAAILAGGEQLTQTGQNLAQGNLANYEQLDWQGSPEERARIENEVYARLTRNVDRDYAQEFDAMEQRMYNRGIPLDPSNPAYKREMDALNEKYSAIKANAQGQAVQMGGQEMVNSYGIAQSSHQQGMADTQALQGMGSGYVGAPTTQFTGPALNQSNFTDAALNRQAMDVQRYGIDKGYQASIYGANKSAEAAAAAGEGEEEEIPT